ncbi:MAG TPA: peptidoglycan DD-metalloendopeptidase family protein, partial [Candidatus Sulfotelmatobacter sp.]|nr:peptidoglycan DD-metalloendopeptidase family protein [Candidatus Sulfotelmatobacter sp.]
ALAPAGQPAAPKSQESRERLKEVQRELGQEREKAREATRRETALAKELQRLDEDLKVKSRQLRELESRLRASTQRIGTLSGEINVTDARLSQTRLLLKRRLRAMYKQGRFGYVRILLSADDFSGAGRRLKYLAAVASQDQRLIQVYSRMLSDLSQKRAELEQYKAEVADATQKAASTRGQIAEEQRQRRLVLASVRQDKALHLAAIKELDKSARDLQALIARLQSEEERQRRTSRTLSKPGDEAAELTNDGRFERLKGKLPWPASGSLASTFGRQEHPRFHTVTFNRGIEIATPSGRDVVAVADGSVIYADWFKGYGRLVILDHGGGYFTLYAHAGEIIVKPGQAVTRGQVIAKVGDSGSPDGPQLYFELRHKGKPEDPLAWLHPR